MSHDTLVTWPVLPCDTIDRYPDLKPPAQFLTDFKQAFGGEAGWGSGSVWGLGVGVWGLGFMVWFLGFEV